MRPTRRALLRSLAAAAATAAAGALTACGGSTPTYVERRVTPTSAGALFASLPAPTPVPPAGQPPPTPAPAAAALAAARALPPLPSPERARPVRLFAGTVGPLHGPAFVARAVQLWSERYGLNVEFRYGDPAALLQAVQGGHFEAALLPVAQVVLLYDKGQAITIAAATAYGGHSVVVTPGIDGGQRLRGKTYGAPNRWDYIDLFFRRRVLTGALELRPDEMTLATVPIVAAPDALKRGEVAAYLLPEPWATRAVESGARRLLDWREVWNGGQFHLECLALNRQFVRERPEAARRVVWAHLDGLNAMAARPTAAVQALSLTQGNPFDARTLRDALARVGLDQPRVPPDLLQATIDDCRQNRLLGRAFGPDDVNDYTLQAEYVYQPI